MKHTEFHSKVLTLLVGGAAGCLGFFILPWMILTCGKISEPLISHKYLFTGEGIDP